MISISALRKSFKSGDHPVAALQGIDLEVKRGEFFVLLGPSGSGKTTLLRSVAGLEKPDGGEISLNGKIVFSSGRRVSEPPETRGIGMVFQSYAIWPHLTVAENIGLVLTHGGSRLGKSEAQERIRYALSLVRASRPKSPTTPETVKKWVAFGASVRAAQYLVLGAKARALTEGRYHVSFEDIRALAHPVLRHRILTNFHAQSEGINSDTLIDRLLEAVPLPRSGM